MRIVMRMSPFFPPKNDEQMSNQVKVVRTNRRDLEGIFFWKITQPSEILEFTCLQDPGMLQTYDL